MLLVLVYFSCSCVPWHIQNVFVNAPTAEFCYVVQFYRFMLGECMKPALFVTPVSLDCTGKVFVQGKGLCAGL
jgi:hypothetical protein